MATVRFVAHLPTIDVVVSGLDEQAHLGRCLDAVLKQDYPRELVRVLYVDGGSVDASAEVAHERAASDPRLTVLAGLGRLSLPAAMNLGIREGTGELVAKVDVHGWPEGDYLRRAAEAFARSDARVALVGGRPVQDGETDWGRAVGAARTSRFGTGGSVYAGSAAGGPVESVQCGVYRRAVLEQVGGFDERMQLGEDDELSWRLAERGYGIELDTAIRFHYLTRSTPTALFRQYRGYGRAKVRVTAAHPRRVRPWHLAPLALVTGGTWLAGAGVRSSRARRLAGAGVAAYGLGAAVATARAGSAHPVRTLACFPLMHLGYGLGNVQGIADAARHALRR